MKIFGTLLGMALGLALLVAFLAGGYFLFKYVANLFGALDPQAETIVMIASTVAFLCAVIVASGLKAGSSNAIPPGKINLYQQVLVLWSEQLKGEHGGKEQVVTNNLFKLEQYLALHGSPKVITAYMNLRRSTMQEGKMGDEAHELLKKLLMEMRADIGQTNFNPNTNDLLNLLLGRHE